MSGEGRSIRRRGSDIVARASGALNWLAIGGVGAAIAGGVIVVRPPPVAEPTAAAVAMQATSQPPYDAAAKQKKQGVRQAIEAKPPEQQPERAPSPAPAVVPAPLDPPPSWSEAEIKGAREDCAAAMSGVAAEWSPAPPMRAMTCGAPGPITLRSVGAQKVALTPPAMTNCATAAALARWIDQHVQPAALKQFGVPVVRVTVATSYECRNRYGQKDAPLSEHALANAVDLSGFKLRDGRTVTVLGGWGPTARSTQAAAASAAKPDGDALSKAAPVAAGKALAGKEPADAGSRMQLGARASETARAAKAATPVAQPVAAAVVRGPEAEFLHSVHSSACSVFGTVLGPEANEAHRDHFHLDMKYRRRSAICQ